MTTRTELEVKLENTEEALAQAIDLIRDYYWATSRVQGRKNDTKAREFLEQHFPAALTNGNLNYNEQKVL